jgi:hypothetical protein
MIVALASLQKTESKVALTDPDHLKPLSKMSKIQGIYLNILLLLPSSHASLAWSW